MHELSSPDAYLCLLTSSLMLRYSNNWSSIVSFFSVSLQNKNACVLNKSFTWAYAFLNIEYRTHRFSIYLGIINDALMSSAILEIDWQLTRFHIRYFSTQCIQSKWTLKESRSSFNLFVWLRWIFSFLLPVLV